MEFDLAAGNLLEVVLNAFVFVGLLILLAYANRTLFEELVAKTIVDPAVRANKIAWIKQLQPVLVLVASFLIAVGLKQPLDATLGALVPVDLLEDPVWGTLLNTLLIAAATFKVHKVEEKKEEVAESQKAIADTTVASMKANTASTQAFTKDMAESTGAGFAA